MPGYGEPKPAAPVTPAGRSVGLGEGGEEGLDLFRLHPDARIHDLEPQPRPETFIAVLGENADADLTFVGELGGIARQVDEYLAQPQRVAQQEPGHPAVHRDDELHVLRHAHADHRGDIVEHFPEVELDVLDDDLAGLDLREIEDVVQNAQKRLGRTLDLEQVIPLTRGQPAAQGQVDHAQDGVHGRADLMAHVGQEAALGLVGDLGFPRQSFGPGDGLFELPVEALHGLFGLLARADVHEAFEQFLPAADADAGHGLEDGN
ncbi:hypothetical protein DSECCO2_622480 [anaerobic digester metagenome]